jgi:hypothetical protein
MLLFQVVAVVAVLVVHLFNKMVVEQQAVQAVLEAEHHLDNYFLLVFHNQLLLALAVLRVLEHKQ